MKKLILISTILFFGINVEAQSFGDILSAGLDGLLLMDSTNPKMNGDQQLLLGAVSGLFKNKSRRDHEINLANAQSTSVTLNGMSSQMSSLNGGVLSRDLEGNIYFTLNGITTKINTDVVKRTEKFINAPAINNSTLIDYDLTILKDGFNFNTVKVEPEMENYYLSEKKEYLNTIASKFNVPLDKIIFVPYIVRKGKITVSKSAFKIPDFLGYFKKDKKKRFINKIYNSEMPLIKNELGCNSFVGLLLFPFEGFRKFQLANGFMIVINKTSTLNKYDFKVVTSFTCNWAKDFDGNGYDFSDFHGIKRSFIQNDNIQIVTGYTSEKSGEWELEVYSNSNGSTVWTDIGLITKGGNYIFSKITDLNLPIGVYIYNITLNSGDNDKVSKSEKFEIIEE